MSNKYAVVCKETGKVYRTFEHWGEALYCITDSFGPEGHLMKAIELPPTSKIKWVVAYEDPQGKKNTSLFDTQRDALNSLGSLNIGNFVEIAKVELDCDGDWTRFDSTQGYLYYEI